MAWSTWRVDQVGSGLRTIEELLEQGFPMHRIVLEEMLGHRGDVVVAAANRWKTPGEDARTVLAVRERVSVADLGTSELLGILGPEPHRWVRRLVYEPE
jgi:hypothetical protein